MNSFLSLSYYVRLEYVWPGEPGVNNNNKHITQTTLQGDQVSSPPPPPPPAPPCPTVRRWKTLDACHTSYLLLLSIALQVMTVRTGHRSASLCDDQVETKESVGVGNSNNSNGQMAWWLLPDWHPLLFLSFHDVTLRYVGIRSVPVVYANAPARQLLKHNHTILSLPYSQLKESSSLFPFSCVFPLLPSILETNARRHKGGFVDS